MNVDINVDSQLAGSRKFQHSAGPESQSAEPDMLQTTREFLGASHWSWVPIRQVTGPRGTSWEPFAPRGSGRGLWARSRKERVLAGLAAKRGRRKTGAEQVRAPGNLPNRHPSRRAQSPKKPGKTGLSAVEN